MVVNGTPIAQIAGLQIDILIDEKTTKKISRIFSMFYFVITSMFDTSSKISIGKKYFHSPVSNMKNTSSPKQ